MCQGTGPFFIVMSLLWGWGIDRKQPDRFDVIGMTICCVGAAVSMITGGARAALCGWTRIVFLWRPYAAVTVPIRP